MKKKHVFSLSLWVCFAGLDWSSYKLQDKLHFCVWIAIFYTNYFVENSWPMCFVKYIMLGVQWSVTQPYILHWLDVLLMCLSGMRNVHWPMTLGLSTYYVALCFPGSRSLVFVLILVILVCSPSNLLRDLSLTFFSDRQSVVFSWFRDQQQLSVLSCVLNIPNFLVWSVCTIKRNLDCMWVVKTFLIGYLSSKNWKKVHVCGFFLLIVDNWDV